MALVRATHDKGRIHVDVVTGEVKRDQALEDNGPPREGRGQEDQKARSCTPICDHVEDRAETRTLLVVSRSVAVEGVEEAGDAIEKGTRPWVQWHVVERRDGENDSNIA